MILGTDALCFQGILSIPRCRLGGSLNIDQSVVGQECPCLALELSLVVNNGYLVLLASGGNSSLGILPGDP